MTTGHEELKKELAEIMSGDVEDSETVITEYSRDTSLFKVPPELVVFPRNDQDVKALVNFVRENREKYPELSLTGRSAGTDMTGGPLTESVVLSFTRYFDEYEVDEDAMEVSTEPGVYYRDLEKALQAEGLLYPPYPASKTIAAMGGIVMNNSGGERTLRYGKTEDYVKEVSMVLSDGNEYDFGPIPYDELSKKKEQDDFEGEVYRKMDNLVTVNNEVIKAGMPKVSKNSAGYDLWHIKDEETFDLSKLFVGAQGTLGMMTKAKLKVVKEKPYGKMVVLYFKSWDNLPTVVNKVLPYDPESLEMFDDDTMKLALRFLPGIAQKAGERLIPFIWHFLPEAWVGIKMLRMPKLVMIVELAEDSEEEVERKAQEIHEAVSEAKGVISRVLPPEDEKKYWVMRRQSFNLLRNEVKGKAAAPFVEDFCIDPEKFPEFLPKFLAIMKKYKIKANLTGHAGNGNYHTIPLMDLKKKENREKIPKAMDEINALIVEFGGTITAEHNDGILRTPYLEMMFGEDMSGLFEQVKAIFDPKGIFNPGKKVGGSKAYMVKHITPKDDF